MIPKKRGPRAPHKMNEQVLELVQTLMASEDGLTLEELARRVETDLGVKLHPANIARRLKVVSKKNPRRRRRTLSCQLPTGRTCRPAMSSCGKSV